MKMEKKKVLLTIISASILVFDAVEWKGRRLLLQPAIHHSRACYFTRIPNDRFGGPQLC